MSKPPIRCDLQDYVEIACLYHFEVSLTMQDGSLVQGRAMDVGQSDGEEVLRLNTAKGPVQAILANAIKMRAITANPHFSEVTFR